MTSPLPHYQNIPLRALQNQERTLYYSSAAEELEQSLCSHLSPSAKLPFPNLVSIIDKHTQQGGTGLLLNKYGFILTSYHLVNQFQKNPFSKYQHHIHNSSHRSHPIDPSFFAYDPLHDLAIIRSLGVTPPISSVTISPTPLGIGKSINYFSFVDGERISLHQGKIQSTSYDVYYPKKTILDAIAFSGEGQRGFSGAPLFNNQNHLVGNLFGGGYLDDNNDQNNNSDEEINFGTKAIYITKLIQDLITNLHHTK